MTFRNDSRTRYMRAIYPSQNPKSTTDSQNIRLNLVTTENKTISYEEEHSIKLPIKDYKKV